MRSADFAVRCAKAGVTPAWLASTLMPDSTTEKYALNKRASAWLAGRSRPSLRAVALLDDIEEWIAITITDRVNSLKNSTEESMELLCYRDDDTYYKHDPDARYSAAIHFACMIQLGHKLNVKGMRVNYSWFTARSE